MKQPRSREHSEAENPQLFRSAVAQLGIELTQCQLERFKCYEALLREWNKRVNLVARTDVDRLPAYHFVDSLTAYPLIPVGSAVCDLGSGGGLPGIPVKIVRDDISMALVESIHKKALFLQEAVTKLGLEQTEVLNQRAETIKSRRFDVILCRLAGRIDKVLRTVAPLLVTGGIVIFYKSVTLEAELKTAQSVMDRLRLRLDQVREFQIPPVSRRLAVLIRD